MTDSESDSDDLFYYSGRDAIQKQFEKRMDVKKEGMEMTTKSIFDSDNENEENEMERSVSSSKREGSVMEVDDSVNRKKVKTIYDAELYLEAIEKASSEEAKMVERSGTPTKEVTERMNKLSLLLKNGEKRLERMNKEMKKMEKESEVLPVEPVPPPVPITPVKEVVSIPSCIEILKGDEREEALEGDPVSVEGKVTLILRSSSDEKKREAIRILRSSKLVEVNKVIGLCGFGGGYVTFDGERLKGNASCESLDMEDGDILDVEV